MKPKKNPMKPSTSSDFSLVRHILMLWHIQQRKLRLPPFEQHGVPFSLVMAESDILMVNVPVASLQLFYQPAFGVSSVPQELRRTDIESQRAKKQLSRLHYYPNQRNVYPVKQIFICN